MKDEAELLADARSLVADALDRPDRTRLVAEMAVINDACVSAAFEVPWGGALLWLAVAASLLQRPEHPDVGAVISALNGAIGPELAFASGAFDSIEDAQSAFDS